MPDYAKDPPRGRRRDGEPPETWSAEAALLRTFLEGGADDLQVAKARKLTSAQAYRAPNQHAVQALDHGLRGGLGLSVKDFVVESPPKPLASNQKRYYVEARELPGWTPPFPGEPHSRLKSCVEEEGTENRWVEVPTIMEGGRIQRRSLHLFIDLGSVGAPAAHWLFQVAGVRGTVADDWSHSDWNIFNAAISDANLEHVVLERVLVQNTPSGPYKGAAFHQEVKSQGTKYLECADHNDPLFVALFDRICRAASDDPPDYGSERHRRVTFESLKQSVILKRKGHNIRRGRWYHVFDACDDMDVAMPHLLLFILYIGIKEGYWSSVEESPVGEIVAAQGGGNVGVSAEALGKPGASASSSAPMAPPERGAATRPTKSRAVALSNSEVDSLRKRSRNTLDLTAKILAHELNTRLMQGIRIVVEPFRRAFRRGETMMRTPAGVFQFYQERAVAKNIDRIVMETFGIFDGGVLDMRLGFLDVDEPSPLTCMVEEDEMVGMLLFRFAVSLAGRHILQWMQWSFMVPGMLVLLLHHDESVVASTLQRLEKVWEIIVKSEELACTDGWVRGRMHELVQFKWAWVREIFIILSEFQFRHVPQEVAQEVRRLYTSQGCTIVNENAFNTLNAQSELSRKKDLRSKARWHALVGSTLTGEFGRAPPPRTSESDAAVSGQALPATLFHNDAEDFSLGMGVLRTISSDRSWRSPSAESWFKLPTFLARLVEVDGDWTLMKRSWYASLLEVGTVFVDTRKNKHTWSCM